MTDAHGHTNRLIHESSPYLLQHAHNPVDWYPWGPEALELARRENRMIFLSIGYSACHWCHVMEQESFSDEEVAKALSGFVAIKVDREERPDLDELYMTAAMLITGSGGWPLSVFLTPDARPFYAGTYFPKQPRQGLPGFIHILANLLDRHRLSPADIDGAAAEVTEAIERNQRAFQTEEPAVTHAEGGYRQLLRLYDPARGGFGGAPKFPQAMALRFLLAYHRRTRDATALEVAQAALEAMHRGGIFDQLGGGFHRYSVDERWLVPHFEKMLYDQAMLAPAYLEAWRLTGKEGYREAATNTLDYVLGSLTSPEGGFLSSQAADSPNAEGRLEEGAYWAWRLAEVERLLPAGEAEAVAVYYGISEEGNLDGASVLHRPRTPEQAARYLRVELEEFQARLAKGREALMAARSLRPKPAVDGKVICGWNGLMIEALAEGWRETNDARYLAAAEKAAGLALSALRPGGSLKHSYINGQARIGAFADDYASLAEGLVALHKAGSGAGSKAGPSGGWLAAARELMGELLAGFQDAEGGGLLFARRDTPDLIVPVRKAADSPTPNANAWAARVLLALAREGEPSYRDRARELIAPYVSQAAQSPIYMASTLLALEEMLEEMP